MADPSAQPLRPPPTLDALAGRHVVVTGGAGFLGSHLCTRLIDAGAAVTAVDNFLTGDPDNVAHLTGRKGFTLVSYDVTNYLHVPGRVDDVLHFASPASPVDYLRHPIQTLKVGSLGTHKALGMSRAKGARFLLASTSEVYGDPLVNPQPETYWGNVNPIGPRGVYDEAKRFSEAMTLAYHREHGVDVRIVRIFNSVLADEQVLYDDGYELRREPIEQLARRLGSPTAALDGYRLPAFDVRGAVEAREAIALEGHPTTQRCYRVTTRYGRTVRVTGDHSLFVEGPDGRPLARPVTQLRVGDRVAIHGRVRVPERDRFEVSLIEAWREQGRDPWDLVVHAPGLGDVVHEHRHVVIGVLTAHHPAPHGRTRQSALAALLRYRRSDSLPLGALQRAGIAIPSGASVRLRTGSPAGGLPARISISDELLWLLGLYVAEGGRYDSDKGGVVHLSADGELLDRAAKVIERELGLRIGRTPGSSARSASLRLNSRLLLVLLDHLGFVAGPKRVPGWVLGLPLQRLKWFIEGYREGDGVHSGEKLALGTRHEWSTTSEVLKDDLVVAFARFGLVPSVGRYSTTLRQRTGDRTYPFWRLTLCDVRPWSPLEWDADVAQTLQARRYGDLVFAHVKAIEEVPATDLVYDFSVPGAENFWAGGVACHNTYGERLRLDDGRAVPEFMRAAIEGRPLPIQGDGLQTRSLCYVDDLVEGILRLQLSDYVGPVNIGNRREVTVLELAQAVQDAVGSHPGLKHLPAAVDDPKVRRPDTTLAERLLGWEAQVGLEEGLSRTAVWFREALARRG